MRKLRVVMYSILALAVVSVLWLGVYDVTAQEQETAGTVVVDGLNGPQGVLVPGDGSIWVIDVGLGGDEEVEALDPNTNEVITATYGSTARVIRVSPQGQSQLVATLPSIFLGSDIVGGARLALLNQEMYATAGLWQGFAGQEALPHTAAVLRVLSGEVQEIVPLWEIEKAENPDGFVLESHPYGLTPGPDGFLYVADAGANMLVRVDVTEGTAEVITVFDGVPGPLPNPNRGGALQSDPVPTGVTFGTDDRIYVSFLPGFPFLPGTAKVVVVDLDSGAVEDFATDLTMLTDLRTGPDGELYAVQFGVFTEEGPTPNSGAVVRIGEGNTSQPVITGLPFPTSVDFDEDGNAFVVINGVSVGEPSSGAVIRFDGVAVEDTPLIRYIASETDSEPVAEEATPTVAPEFVVSCDNLPAHEVVTQSLTTIVDAGNSAGLGNHMWATIVNRDGEVCAVTYSGTNRGDQWPGGRVLSIQKANTANAFSLPGMALSTANLHAAVQPGGRLYGLQHSNPIHPLVVYAGPTTAYGQPDDPTVGQRPGGVHVFGGGLPLYDANGSLLGALGISGDTACTDHIIAWKLRDALDLDYVPAGMSSDDDDNIIFDIQEDGSSPSGFGHPLCGFDEETLTEELPTDFPIGSDKGTLE